MKKALFFLFILFSVNVCAQESIYDMIVKKKPKEKPKNELDLAGMCLQKSAKYQYGAIGFGAVSTGLIIASSFMKDDYKMVRGDLVKDKNKTKRALLIGGASSAFIAICCELTAIDYKMKAGKSIRLYATGKGAKLAFTF